MWSHPSPNVKTISLCVKNILLSCQVTVNSIMCLQQRKVLAHMGRDLCPQTQFTVMNPGSVLHIVWVIEESNDILNCCG